jgi:hypothetical protein
MTIAIQRRCQRHLSRYRTETAYRGVSKRASHLIAMAGLLAATLAIQNVIASNLASCVRQKIPFDGSVPLRYESVVGGTGSKIYLHPQFPSGCVQGGDDACKASAYVVPGDIVATTKTCGGWAFVQYIGSKRITTGWVPERQLAPRAAEDAPELPATEAAPVKNADAIPLPPPRRYLFRLTQGHGVPVCEAYLQRLNQTLFKVPPYCGRPESTLVPGFEPLHRQWMSVSQFTHLYIPVTVFLEDLPNDLPSIHRKGPDGTDIFGPPAGGGFPTPYMPSTWIYDPPVDIENNGAPDNVAIWDEYDRLDVFPPCFRDMDFGVSTTGSHSSEEGIILKPDMSGINTTKTAAVFGHPDGGFLFPTGPHAEGPVRLYHAFRPIGTEVGIFEYRGVNYFDTFFSTLIDQGDFRDRRKNDQVLRDTLGVFLRRANHTHQVCEYHLENEAYRQDNSVDPRPALEESFHAPEALLFLPDPEVLLA